MTIWSSEIKELESLYTSIKGRFPGLEKDLEHLIKTDDENVALLYSRRCLEIIVTDLCESELKRPRKTEPLKGIIDKLHREEKVPSHIITSMDHLNSLSTYGTHPKEFDPEQVKPVLFNLTTIIKWYIKYKDTQIISHAKSEEVKYESKEPVEAKEDTKKLKKRLIFLSSGILLVVVIAFVVLFVFGVIGGKKETKEIEKSIAVLPFENLSTDEDQAWFSDGITDVIISQLSKITDLRVLGRTSTLKYKEKEERKSIQEIGKELGVNFVIEGTVQRQENKMRISVQLIRTLNEGHIWSDIYDREWKDIFDVQSDIAQKVADQLKTILTPIEKELIEKYQTKNPAAYSYYLQGRYFWFKRTEEGLKKSVEYFEKSIEEDSDYALAYAGMADSYYILSLYGWIPRPEGYSRAKELALSALEMDKNLAEAHTTLGNILYFYEWNWEEARKELIHALELNPNYSTVYMCYSELLDIIGQENEAIEIIKQGIEIDPFVGIFHAAHAIFLYNVGKFKESLDECIKTVELNPDFSFSYLMFYNYIKLDEGLKAVEVLQKILPDEADYIKEAFDKSGIKGLLKCWIELEQKKSEPSYSRLANLYAMMGEKEKALDCLEKGFESAKGTTWLPRINTNLNFDNLRSEPRFVALIEKMGLSQYPKRK